MKINYFSSGPRERVLAALMKAGHEILTVFVTEVSDPSRLQATINIADAAALPVRFLSRDDLISLGSELEGQFCLSVGFKFLFPSEFLSKVSCVNVHGGLLPRYAGARTLNWTIANNEIESGISIHKVDDGMDTGPLLMERRFPLSKFETGASLARKILELEPSLVVRAIDLIEAGKASFVDQPERPKIRLPDRSPNDSQIDPFLPLVDLFDQIRAADPDRYPAHFFVNGEKVCIRLWRPEKPDDEADLL